MKTTAGSCTVTTVDHRRDVAVDVADRHAVDRRCRATGFGIVSFHWT